MNSAENRHRWKFETDETIIPHPSGPFPPSESRRCGPNRRTGQAAGSGPFRARNRAKRRTRFLVIAVTIDFSPEQRVTIGAIVQPTSISLLDLLKHGEDQQAWHQMVEIYQPLIEKWLRRFGAPPGELNDLSQTILTVVVKKLPAFEHGGRTGSFRSWIRAITRNCLLKFWRDNKLVPVATGKTSFNESLNQLADDSSELSQQWNREYDEQVLAAVLKQIRNEFQPQTWEAFKRVVVQEESPSDVARAMGISVNSVFIAKSRVLSRVRVIGKYMID